MALCWAARSERGPLWKPCHNLADGLTSDMLDGGSSTLPPVEIGGYLMISARGCVALGRDRGVVQV